MPTRIVMAELDQHHKDMMNGLAGLSLPARIVHALVSAGYMEKPPQPEHNHFTMAPEMETCEACQETVSPLALHEYLKRTREGYTPKSTPQDLNPQNRNPER